MPIYFLDSSAVVKRYVNEVGSDWITNLTDPTSANSIHIVRITGAEVVSGIARRARGKSISTIDAAAAIALFDHHFAYGYVVAEVSPRLVSLAMKVAETYALRGYDSVQLAAALQLNSACTAIGIVGPVLVSCDDELNAAAISEGLMTDDPRLHP